VDDEPHIHLVCSDCGAVGQQPVDVAVGLAEAVRASVGFRADLRHLTLHGWCAACAEAARVEADADADVVADHEEAARAGTDADPDAAADQAEADADRDSDPAPASSTPDQTEHSGSPQASPTFPPT
jgi:hypothetical protein